MCTGTPSSGNVLGSAWLDSGAERERPCARLTRHGGPRRQTAREPRTHARDVLGVEPRGRDVRHVLDAVALITTEARHVLARRELAQRGKGVVEGEQRGDGQHLELADREEGARLELVLEGGA